MSHFTPVVLAIALATLIVALSALARRLPIPTPILQLVAGLVLGFTPSLAIPDLDPNLVFFVFLPPIIWAAAMFTSPREFRRNFGSIGLLAVGLVITTAVAVAIAARMLMPGMPWAVAVALGAIISPPDAVAATAIVSRMPVPRRVITVLEGESLVNDATALVLYRTAVAAAVVGTFSWGESIVRFFIDAGIGCVVGLVVGWLIIRAACWTRDPLAETLLTLAGPYVAWLSAESIHVSSVLACVAGGLYVQQKLSIAVGPASRLQIRTVWDLAIFLLNAMVFLLLGAQFGSLIAALRGEPIMVVARAGIIITTIVVAVRIVWVPLLTLVRIVTKTYSRLGPPSWQAVTVISWTSMRGVVSLATALALPRTLATGVPFPYRTQIILITMCVIVLTLVVQGLSLAPIIRALRFEPERQHEEEEQLARREATRRGAEALEDLAQEEWADPRDIEVLRSEVRDRARTGLTSTEERRRVAAASVSE